MSNSSIIQVLGELEKEVMDVVWKNSSPVTVREVLERISKKRKVAYTTVMTIMTRLVAKGLLKRKLYDNKAYTYQVVYSKGKFLTKTSKQIIKNFISNFGESAIAHFAQEIEKIPADKRRRLLKMLEDTNK